MKVEQLRDMFAADKPKPEPKPEPASNPTPHSATPKPVEAADFVDEPAANEGLFGDQLNALAARGDEHLRFLEEELGAERVQTFLADYLRSHGLTVLAEAPAPPEPEPCGACEALRTEVAQLRQAEAAWAQAANEAYVQTLREKAAVGQVMLQAADLEHVTKLLSLGMREEAEFLGTTLLNAALVKAGKPFSRTEGSGPPLQTSQTAPAEAEAEMLTSLGWKVELSTDKSKILKKLKSK